MAEFEVTGPDGRKHKITGPVGATQQDAIDEVMRQLGEPRQAYGGTATEHETRIPPSGETTMKGGISSFLEGVPVAGEYLASKTATPEQRKEFKQYFPAQDFGLGALGGAAATGAALAAPGIGELAAPAVGAARWARPLGNAVMGGAGGAAIGGADAYARGQDPRTGAMLGGVTGAAAPIIGRGAEAAYRGLSEAVRPNPLPGVGARARGILNNNTGDLNPAAAAYARQTLGPQGFIGEMTPGLQDITAGISRESGPAATVARQAFLDRLGGAPGRTEASVTGNLGQRANVPQTIEQVLQDRSTSARPFYQAAEARPFPNDPRLHELMQDPNIQAGLVRGHTDAQTEALAKGIPYQPNGWRMAFNAKTGLDNMVEDERNDLGRLSPKGRSLSMLRNAWRDRLDELNPDYARARREWEGPTQTVNAMREGQRALSRGFDRNDMAEQFNGYTSAAAQDAYRIGMRNNIAMLMDGARRGDVTARNLLLSEGAHGKISEAFGQYRAEDLREALQHEVGISDRTPRFVPNPNTGASLTTAPEQRAMVNPQGALSRYGENFKYYDPKTWLGTSIDPVTHLSARDERLNTAAKQQLAPLLTSPIRNDLVDALMAARQRQQSIDRQSGAAGRGVSALIAGPGAQISRKANQKPQQDQ